MTFAGRGEMQYLLYLPPDYEAHPDSAFPLLLFLHGGGESGDEIDKVATHGPPMQAARGDRLPFIVLSPQNPHVRGFWEERVVKALLDSIVQQYRVDTQRLYLTGLSRGGYGAWRVAMSFPETFAALVPICGATAESYAGWVPDIPIWVFHGDRDPVVPMSESNALVGRLLGMGRKVRYTLYPGVGHNSWERAYAEPELYPWLLEQRKP
ncbi:MAG: alpha/beta hydrolase [Bacteroidetes bacterium]|nr:MAG: alpha/beta hydrolase [Bacteroidota bacterium]